MSQKALFAAPFAALLIPLVSSFIACNASEFTTECPYCNAENDGGQTDAGGGDAQAGAGGGDAQTGVGGSGGAPQWPVPCVTDADCVPFDAECLPGSCLLPKGECVFPEGEILASQKYGDCKRRECSAGKVELLTEANDVYDDSNDCTLDICTDEGPLNVVEEDGTPCEGEVVGHCFQMSCKECIAGNPWAECNGGLVCDGFWCEALASCGNGECGGVCAPCGIGQNCSIDSDCVTNACIGGKCQAAACDDGRKNPGETDVDCGGPCPPCPAGEACVQPEDCESGVCKHGVCEAPTCVDYTLNGGETGIDCGGPCSPCK